jgi:hypothetical protein
MPEPTMRPTHQLQVVTIGPYDDDWAVVDATGQVLYIGHAVYAARVLAKLSSES